MGKYPVTQRQWESVMGRNPSHRKGENRPVERVTWSEAREFLGKLSRRGDGHRYRLPTEAEWEYAARAGSQANEEQSLSAMAWYSANSGNETHPVGEKLPNGWGLYDILGNVWEWCEDWEGAYPTGPVVDPQGPASGSRRVIRGGSLFDLAETVGVAIRDYYVPTYDPDFIGFRCLREVNT